MDLVIRATVVFFFILLVTRVVGRREIAELEPFDLILLVVMGDLVQQGITQSDQSVTGTLTVISTIALLSVAVSWASFRFRRVRLVTEGQPIVLVQDGHTIERNLRRADHRRGHPAGRPARTDRLGRRAAMGDPRGRRSYQLYFASRVASSPAAGPIVRVPAHGQETWSPANRHEQHARIGEPWHLHPESRLETPARGKS